MDFLKWVLTTSLMATPLVALILAIKYALGNRLKPRWHYLLWLLLTLRLLIPWAPESSFSIFNLFTNPSQTPIQLMNTDIVSPLAPAAIISKVTLTPAYVVESTSITLLQIGFWIWLLVVIGLSFYTILVNRRFANTLSKQACVSDPTILRLLEQCKQQMNVKRDIRLMVSNQTVSPTLFGFLQPSLIISYQTLAALSLEQLRYIFLHELAHYKRKDIAVNWVMQVLLILHWFNPILWYAYYRMREDQEIACDAQTLTYIRSNEVQEYGQTIISLLEGYTPQKHISGLARFFGNKKQLTRRITMIKLFKPASFRWSILGCVVLLLIAGLFLTDGKTSATSLEELTSKSAAEVQKNPGPAARSIITDYFTAIMAKGDTDGAPLMSFKVVGIDTSDMNRIKASIASEYEEFGIMPAVDYSLIKVKNRYQVEKQVCVYDMAPTSPTKGTVHCDVNFIEGDGTVSVLGPAEVDPAKLISKDEHEKMIKIIKDVNAGYLPESALKDAQPLLDKDPQYRLSHHPGDDYINAGFSETDFKRMIKVIQDVNVGLLPEASLKEAQPLLDKMPEYRVARRPK
ncbi:hypothetical protein EHS13_03280 [Paenibacillus psychroresistens]|uniref:Peptidase M56 domain-containing protein n=1 Tax=Paenibacillus psychroresistens TaxID=1778678 RepID=A0A6B8REY9_9BACL|nr:M56 family metallopeptidase [Paenibacillus psychroresistens]QGQ93998.1 hypothetical protein EHS13_03280 [Paenibacillus psychroresistens]